MRSVDEDKGANGSVGLPKNGKTRMVDILPGDIQALKKHKAARAAVSFEFFKPKALVFGVGADNHMRWGDTVSQRLGRKTISITLDIYSHFMPSIQSEAVQRLGRYWSKPCNKCCDSQQNERCIEMFRAL